MSQPAAVQFTQQPSGPNGLFTEPSCRDIAPDCRHYLGDRPCRHNRLCAGCEHYEPYSHRICIIKVGALGDVIRTLCLLPELRRQFPAAHITWVSKPNGCRILAGHRLINRLLPLDAMTALTLQQEKFDTVINLDKEPQPSALATSLRSANKLGIGLSVHGTPIPFNAEAKPYFLLGLSDELKFQKNKNSYPQLIYQAMGWAYRGQRYELPIDPLTSSRVRFELASRGWRPHKSTLGINVGAGYAFANKMWPAPRVAEVVRLTRERFPELQIVLLGGPNERSLVSAITARLKTQHAMDQVIDAGTDHDERSFLALVDTCDVLFSGDTMAMHVAIALGKHVVAFIGPTCEQEIDLFGKGEKLIANVPCAPCYKRMCDQNDACVYQIDAGKAVDAIERILPIARPKHSALLPLRLAG